MSTSTLSRSTPAASESTPPGAPRLPSVARLSFTIAACHYADGLERLHVLAGDHKTRHATILGDTTSPDHMTVNVLIQNVDPSTARVSAQLQLKGARAPCWTSTPTN